MHIDYVHTHVTICDHDSKNQLFSMKKIIITYMYLRFEHLLFEHLLFDHLMSKANKLCCVTSASN